MTDQYSHCTYCNTFASCIQIYRRHQPRSFLEKHGKASTTEEAEGLKDYVSTKIASYLTYTCSYCTGPFLLVNPSDDYNAGGAILKQVLKNDDGGFKDFGKVRGVCLQCSRAILLYQQSKRS